MLSWLKLNYPRQKRQLPAVIPDKTLLDYLNQKRKLPQSTFEQETVENQWITQLVAKH